MLATEVITRIFPTLLITLDLLASGVYALHLDWRRCIYWFAAAVLTASITW